MNTRNKTLARHLVELFSGLTFLTALVLAAMPFAMGYPRSSELTTMSVALGTLIATLSAARALGAYDARTFSAFNMALALLTLLSPWLLQHAQTHAFVRTHLVCGAIMLLCSSAAFTVSHLFRPIETHPWLHEAA